MLRLPSRAALLATVLPLACAHSEATEAGRSPAPRSQEAPQADFQGEAAHDAPSASWRELHVDGHLPAVLLVPASEGRLPLIVASHGAGGTPEGECDYWRSLSRDRAILVCPRGVRIRAEGPSGYFYRTHLELEREFLAVVKAVHTAFGSRIAPNLGTYAGFSQGAIMGAAMIPPHGKQFPFLVLIEGGYEYWSPVKARAFAKHGGKRVVFSCGTSWCADKSRQPASWLRDAGVEARIEADPSVGHSAGGNVMRQTRAALPWLWEARHDELEP